MTHKNSLNKPKPFGSTLFLVNSPFQCLCMLEAIHYFNISKYDILITYSDKFSLDKIDNLLRTQNITYKKKHASHIIYGILPILFSKHPHYKNIFVGDFYSKGKLVIAYIYSSFRANLFYLDDGVQALEFFSQHPRQTHYKFKVKLVYILYELIRYFKIIKKPVFFTIFNVSSSHHKIINNPFSLLKNENTKDPKGIYIIGTNSSIVKFKNFTYLEYLTALHKHLSDRFPKENFYYCPHRRDKNNIKIINQCKKLNIDIFNTDISVEYDFVNKNINPQLIVGFTSNALYTLKIIYPNAKVETVMYQLKNLSENKSTQVIRDRMAKNGIATVNVI